MYAYQMPFTPIDDDAQETAYPIVPVRNYADGRVYAFTDGALSRCKLTDIQFGGWGVYIKYRKHEKRLSGSKAGTSTQEMELEAVRQAVIVLTDKAHNKKVQIYIDNKWCVECIQRALSEYRANNNVWRPNSWVTLPGKLLLAKSIVKDIVEKATTSFTFYWVKGHSNVAGNDEADKLAVAARQQLKTAYLAKCRRDHGTSKGTGKVRP